MAKINPFDIVKGETIKKSFNIGKLDWATILIITDPPAPEKEAKVYDVFKTVKNPSLLSQAMVSCQQVRENERAQDFDWMFYLIC